MPSSDPDHQPRKGGGPKGRGRNAGGDRAGGGRDAGSGARGGARGGQERRGRQPAGIDRARQSADAPPRPRRTATAPPRPALPRDEEPQLPRGVLREIRRVLGDNRRADDVALALSIGSAAIDEDRIDIALEMLAWAKSQAARIATVREAYGVALYLAGDWPAAVGELRAYRRMTGRNDQNHLIADCHRAMGRPLADVIGPLQELVEDQQAPRDRRLEAVVIWAAALADSGDVAAGRALLRRTFDREDIGSDEAELRLHGLAADLAERDGDPAAALHHLEVIASVDDELFDAGRRLQQLRAT